MTLGFLGGAAEAGAVRRVGALGANFLPDLLITELEKDFIVTDVGHSCERREKERIAVCYPRTRLGVWGRTIEVV